MMNHEPAPGARLEPRDFEHIIRLTPLVSIDLVVRSPDGRVLVGCRRNEPAKGCFFTAGGRITKNETLAAAFKRISLAELGVEKQIEEARFLGVYEHFYTTNNPERPGFGTHYVVLAYELTAPPQDWRLPSDQHGEFAWLSEAELLQSPQVHKYTKAYFLSDKSGRWNGGRMAERWPGARWRRKPSNRRELRDPRQVLAGDAPELYRASALEGGGKQAS